MKPNLRFYLKSIGYCGIGWLIGEWLGTMLAVIILVAGELDN